MSQSLTKKQSNLIVIAVVVVIIAAVIGAVLFLRGLNKVDDASNSVINAPAGASDGPITNQTPGVNQQESTQSDGTTKTPYPENQ